MKVLIEAPFQISEKDRNQIESVIQKLSVFNRKITQAEVFFKLNDKEGAHSVYSEIRLHVPGPDIFASDSSQEAIKAFKLASEKVKRQMREAKDKKANHH